MAQVLKINNVITLTSVAKNEVAEVWPKIETWVKSALGEDESLSSDDIREMCTRNLNLWLIHTDELKGFLTFEIYDAPQMKVCYAPWLGGENLNEWVAGAFVKFKHYLKEQGVKQYSFVGRKAWQKLIKADYEGLFYLMRI